MGAEGARQVSLGRGQSTPRRRSRRWNVVGKILRV